MTLAFLHIHGAGTPTPTWDLNPPEPAQTSVVVPVRNNGTGIARLLDWWRELGSRERPRELIIVDDGSRVPVQAMVDGARVVRTRGNGPVAARNLGWRAATGAWIAFTDSDCIPDGGWPGTFARNWRGEIALQGRVRALGGDLLSRFYERQEVLHPMAWTDDARPRYLISANALVLKRALEEIGGFDERFRLAAGEDVDLGLRVAAIGPLRWCPNASVAHDFEANPISFVRRFVRYGRGNRMLVAGGRNHLRSNFAPRPFIAKSGDPTDQALAFVAFLCLSLGWFVQGLRAPPTRNSGRPL